MSMKYKFDKLNEAAEKAKGDEPSPRTAKDIEHFGEPGHVRNLCLVETSGKQVFLNYAYLISGEYTPEENTIVLYFTTHTVTLKGNKLDLLFDDIVIHAVKKIACIDKRYHGLKNDGPSIFEISTILNQ